MWKPTKSHPGLLFGVAVLVTLWGWTPLWQTAEKAFLHITGRGWKATYYREDRKVTKEHVASARLHFRDDPSKLPDPEHPFLLILEGQFRVEHDEPTQFVLRGDDGFRLYVNGELVLDKWNNREFKGSKQTATVELEKGWHDLQIDMRQLDGPPRIMATWKIVPYLREYPLNGHWVRRPE